MELAKYTARVYKNLNNGMWSIQLRKSDLGLAGSGWKVAFHSDQVSMVDAVQHIELTVLDAILHGRKGRKPGRKNVYARFIGTVELPVELVENWTEALTIELKTNDHHAIDERFRVTINPKDANPTLAANFHIANSDILVTDSPSLQFCSNSQCYLA